MTEQAQENVLEERCLELLREWRREYGNCYHSVENIAKELSCNEADLYDWENDRGILIDLHDDGEVYLIGRNDPCVIAMIEEW